MKQMVLPQITPEQVDCARQVARELGLKTEKVRLPQPLSLHGHSGSAYLESFSICTCTFLFVILLIQPLLCILSH